MTKKQKSPAKRDPYLTPEQRDRVIKNLRAKYPVRRPAGTTLH